MSTGEFVQLYGVRLRDLTSEGDKPAVPRPTILVLTDRIVCDLSSGYDLRVYHLVLELARRYRVVNVVADLLGDDEPTLPPLVQPLWRTPIPVRRTVRSLLRRDERDYLRLAGEATFEQVRDALGRTFRAEGASAVVVFNAHVATLVPPELRRLTVVDLCDSTTLILARRAQHTAPTDPQRLRLHLARRRWRSFERWITASFGATTAATRVDAASASTAHAQARTVPNGVAGAVPPAAHPDAVASPPSVAFWGNLDFTPNRDAVAGFLTDVIAPGLLSEDVAVRVIGKNADAHLRKLAARTPQVALEGFQEDLAGSLSGVRAMVNYMRLGSGIKNKVLEAFSWRIPVVSTSRGVEGFEGLVAGEHYLQADTPAAFADALKRVVADPDLRDRLTTAAATYVDRYTWPRAGQELCDIVGLVMARSATQEHLR